MKIKYTRFLFVTAALTIAGSSIASPPVNLANNVAPGDSKAVSTAAIRHFSYSRFAEQPKGLKWPTQAWERGPIDSRVDARKLKAALDAINQSTDPLLGKTYALLLIHKGKIVAERYAADYNCEQRVHTMSVGKMMGAAMAGILVRDGHAALDAPLALAQWPKQDPASHCAMRLIWQRDSAGKKMEMGLFSNWPLAAATKIWRDIRRLNHCGTSQAHSLNILTARRR
jgi:hypothetical protein